MADTVADFVVKRLSQWGVRRVFGFPGDGINGLLGAFERGKHEVKFIQVRHEEMAAFAACAHAKFTGDVGVCVATSGPGAIHLLNGLYDAKMDHMPVVAIVGQAARSAIGSEYQQEVDLRTLFKDVASEYVVEVEAATAVRHCIDRAFRIAKATRQVTCVILPKDLQEQHAMKPPHEHNTAHSSVAYSFPRIVPQSHDLERAAKILNEGKKVAMLVGAGALRATDEVMQVAELTGAGVAKALLGKCAIPDNLPYCTGAIGLLGTKPSWDLMMECDTLLMVGTNFPYSEFLPKEGQARGVQIDINPKLLGLRYPTELNLVGEAKETLRALIPLLDRKADRSWQEKIANGMRDWWKLMEERAVMKAKPLNPQWVFWTLSPKLPENCIITCDSGSSANWFARDLRVRRGMMSSLSGNLATMGSGTPYAIGAKFAFPDRHVIACVGDGAFQMNGMNGLITIAKYWREWQNPKLTLLILNNRDLNQVSWEMRAMTGDPKFDASQDLPDVRYSKYAELLGLAGVFVDDPAQCAEAWDFALNCDRPCVVEAYVDPDVPPLPPHITLKQAKAYATALLRGDPNEAGIIAQSAEEMAPGLLGKLGAKINGNKK